MMSIPALIAAVTLVPRKATVGNFLTKINK